LGPGRRVTEKECPWSGARVQSKSWTERPQEDNVRRSMSRGKAWRRRGLKQRYHRVHDIYVERIQTQDQEQQNDSWQKADVGMLFGRISSFGHNASLLSDYVRRPVTECEGSFSRTLGTAACLYYRQSLKVPLGGANEIRKTEGLWPNSSPSSADRSDGGPGTGKAQGKK